MYWRIYPKKFQQGPQMGIVDKVTNVVEIFKARMFCVYELLDDGKEEWVADFANFDTVCDVVYYHNKDVFDSITQEMDDGQYANHKKFVEMQGYL